MAMLSLTFELTLSALSVQHFYFYRQAVCRTAQVFLWRWSMSLQTSFSSSPCLNITYIFRAVFEWSDEDGEDSIVR